jgi:hypothetical protein
MGGSRGAIFTSRVLQKDAEHFQWLKHASGSSTQHARDIMKARKVLQGSGLLHRLRAADDVYFLLQLV